MQNLNIILLGKAGSGKGTQSERLSSKFNLYHISTGDILRENIKKNTPEGEKAKIYINRGELVPDNLILKLLLNEIRKNQKENINKSNGFIFDGFPRNSKQARLLNKCLKQFFNLEVNFIIDYQLSDKEAVERIQNRVKDIEKNGGKARSDDKNTNSIQKRLDIYKQEADEIKEFYRQNKNINVLNIDAGPFIEDVTSTTINLINKNLNKNLNTTVDRKLNTKLNNALKNSLVSNSKCEKLII